jgi:hypothetical protein
MDFLFLPDRNPFVFLDKEATKVGALFERDMLHGEALTSFGTDKVDLVNEVEDIVEEEKNV